MLSDSDLHDLAPHLSYGFSLDHLSGLALSTSLWNCLHKSNNTSAKSHAAFSALLPLSAGADRGKRAGSREGVAPSGRHGLDLRKGCWKGQRLLKLCRKGQSLPKLCQKGRTCVERVGERGRKVTPKIRINVHKPLHWSINDRNRYIHARKLRKIQSSFRSESSSRSSTIAWEESESVSADTAAAAAFIFLRLPLASAAAKIFSHCLSFNLETMETRLDVDLTRITRPSRVSGWSPQFAFEYSFRGLSGFTISPVCHHEMARFAYISYMSANCSLIWCGWCYGLDRMNERSDWLLLGAVLFVNEG